MEGWVDLSYPAIRTGLESDALTTTLPSLKYKLTLSYCAHTPTIKLICYRLISTNILIRIDIRYMTYLNKIYKIQMLIERRL